VRLILALVTAAAAATAQEWSLGPSDWARYERREATLGKQGKEKLSKAARVTVFGHDVRGGQFDPVSPRRADLAAILALYLPRNATAKRRLKLAKITELRMQGKPENKQGRIAAQWRFASRGKQQKGEAYKISKGAAHVVATFDLVSGLFASARIEISYLLKKYDPKPGEKPKQVVKTYVFKLAQVRRHGDRELRKQINAAIDRGVKHLKTLQKKDGSYEPHGDWSVGTTALAVLTLSACGVAREDPSIAKALLYMDGENPKRTYALALCLMAYERVYTPAAELTRVRKSARLLRDLPPHRRQWCERAAKLLERICVSPGVWEYKAHNARFIPNQDSSNTQYGVLGLRAAARLGIAVRERTWLGAIRHFEQVRERDGKRGEVTLFSEGQALGEVKPTKVPEVAGFMYRRNSRGAWGSMTVAGIGCLTIARHQLRLQKSRKLDAAMSRRIDNLILGGWAWLDRHWAMDRNPEKSHGGAWYYYYLYSLERAGILAGVKRVGDRDWYFEGAVELLARQDKKKGSWNEGGGKDVSETCFALLFLRRATAPLSGGGR